MRILIGYASKHGATREIAEHIATTLRAAGHDADSQAVNSVADLAGYDAFVIGSAVYFGSWRKEATEFVLKHQDLLASRPVWLFSSGPLGTEPTDAEGNDLREVTEPKQIDEFRGVIRPREHRVFFGALDREDFGLTEKLITALPAGRKLLQVGDFRDWEEITAWTEKIARELVGAPVDAA